MLFSAAAFAQIDLSVPMDRYFPYYTAQFTSIPDVARLSSQFDQTDLGILAAQPNMKPFHDSISEQISSGPLKDRLGITLSDLRNVANGEVAFGTIYPNKELLAIALMANISNHAAEANQLVNKVSANVQQKKGRVVRQQSGTALFVQLDYVDENGKNQKTVYIIDGDLMVVCDNLQIAKLLWQKASNNAAAASVKPIAASAYYQMIKRRSSEKNESFTFVQIDRYAEAVQLLDDKYSAGNLTSKSPIEGLKKSGLIGFRATGGSLQLKPAAGFNRFIKGYVYAPKPWTGSMNMYELVNVPCPEPPAWISSKISTYTAVQGTPETVFDNIAPFFDTYFGEGEQGVWADVVEGLEQDPMGPQINLKKDLVQYFDGQLIIISQALEPLGPDAECTAYALRVKDVNAIRSALNRLFNGDPTIKPDNIGQFNIWQCVPKQKKDSAMKNFEIGKQPKKEKPEGPMAHAAIAVENGYLIIASKKEFLAQLLNPTAQPLKDTVGYKRTMAVAKQRCGNSACMWVYSPTENNYRLNYELFKAGKSVESKTMLSRIIKAISGTDSPKTKQQTQTVDGSTLPPFDQIKTYFGTSGGYSKIEADGFSFEEFVLSVRQ